MAEAQLQQFLNKVAALNAFVALSEAEPPVRDALRHCSNHHEVVQLARQHGFEIGRRWGEEDPAVEGGEDNLLAGSCPEAGEEITSVLLNLPNLRLERIHSCNAVSAEGFWYDQAEHEWVMVLQGSARLQFDDEALPRNLSRGDSLLIEPHRRHRVVATDPAPGTVWLALFWPAAGAG
jgi:cupin 2 domain-containing protein